VDTGWINDEKPAERAAADASTHNFQTPIDEVRARVGVRVSTTSRRPSTR
jgi:hypothetical protein